MTQIDIKHFQCHVCGQQFLGLEMVSTNSFMAGMNDMDPTRCPLCDAPAHQHCDYDAEKMVSLLDVLLAAEAIPAATIEWLIAQSMSEDDIESWRAGFAATNWEAAFGKDLAWKKFSAGQHLPYLRQEEPSMSSFISLQRIAEGLQAPSEPIQRFLSRQASPVHGNWQENDRAMAAMLQADRRILDEAEAVVAQFVVERAARQRIIADALRASLPDKVNAYFDTVRQEFARRVREGREQLAARDRAAPGGCSRDYIDRHAVFDTIDFDRRQRERRNNRERQEEQMRRWIEEFEKENGGSDGEHMA